MIQYVPFVASGPLGQAQALAEAAAQQATAWQQQYGLVLHGSPVTTSNLVVGLSDQITFLYTLTLAVEVDGAHPAPWGDPREPAEWKALAAPPPAIPVAAPADTAEGGEAARLAARGLPPPAPVLPDPVRAIRPGGAATDKQLKAIFAIARSEWNWDGDFLKGEVHRRYRCHLDELSKVEASAFLDILSKQVADPDPPPPPASAPLFPDAAPPGVAVDVACETLRGRVLGGLTAQGWNATQQRTWLAETFQREDVADLTKDELETAVAKLVKLYQVRQRPVPVGSGKAAR